MIRHRQQQTTTRSPTRTRHVRFIDADQLLYLAKSWRPHPGRAWRYRSFLPACRCCTYRARIASTRCAPPNCWVRSISGRRARPAGRGVRRHPDRRHCIAGDVAGDQRSQHSDQLYDQLSRILIRWLGRALPAPVLFDPPHVPRVFVPWISVEGMLDTAFEQIRHYAARDAAVSLRLLRAIGDIAGALQQDDARAKLLERARRVVDGCDERLGEVEAARLRQRVAMLEDRLGG